MFGDTVRAHRHRLGMTQEELAGKTGISSRHLRDIEAGRIARPRPSTVRLLADTFALSGAERDSFHQVAAGAAGARSVAGSGPTGASQAPTPAQLPLDVRCFTGRTQELRHLDVIMASVDEQPTAVVVAALSGMAGVGKTALAVHWAHQVRAPFPHGQLYLNLRGFHPDSAARVRPDDAIRGFLEALGVPPQRIPTDLDARIGLYRSLLADKRVLVVLDNARDADQVRPLLPGTPRSMALVTSRNRLTSLATVEGAHILALDLLNPAQARQVLVRRLGERVYAEPDATERIVARCAGLPLALVIVAARAEVQPNRPGLLDRCRRQPGRRGRRRGSAASRRTNRRLRADRTRPRPVPVP